MENATWTVPGIDTSRVLLMAIILSMAGCDSTPPEPENEPPEPVGTIPDQELFVGEEWSVGLAPYFTDADDDTLTYAAEALDDSVISVRVQDETLWVEALSQGSTSVTATATDSEGGSATQSFEVTVPNRSPTSTTIPDMMIEVDTKDTVDLGNHFADPDNDELSYSVRSENGDALVVAVSGEDLVLHAGSNPTLVRVHVVAIDEPGDSATESFQVEVFVDRGEGFRDDFDDESSLDDWSARDLRARVDEDEGLLVLDEEESPTEFPNNPGVFRDVEINRGWKAEFSLGLLGQDPTSSVMIITGDDQHRAWSAEYSWFFEEWELKVYEADQDFWVLIAGEDLVLSEDQTEWEWVLEENGLMTISVEGDEIYRHTFPAGTPTGVTGVGLGFYFSVEQEEGVLYDYFEINPEG